jgi:enoyl-CoA hydratase/carnithine racemase
MSVTVELRDGISVVAIDRPHARNAVDRDTAERLSAAFQEFEANESPVAVLTGAGGNFCAGADLKAAAEGRANRLEPDGDAPLGPSRMLLSKPVIAAVEGYAVAGGLELALWCDLRVASRQAVFGVFCRRFGVPLIDGGTLRLPRLIGHSRALDLILTGRPVNAEEALSFGLVNRLCEPGTALENALELARQIASFPQECLRADRLSSYRQWELSSKDALRAEFLGGLPALQAEGLAGAKKFRSGEGRGGVSL